MITIPPIWKVRFVLLLLLLGWPPIWIGEHFGVWHFVLAWGYVTIASSILAGILSLALVLELIARWVTRVLRQP